MRNHVDRPQLLLEQVYNIQIDSLKEEQCQLNKEIMYKNC